MLKITERPLTPEERHRIENDRIPDDSGLAAKVIIYLALGVLAIPLSLLGMVFFGPVVRMFLRDYDSAMTYAYLCSLAGSLYVMFRVAHGEASLVQAWTSKPRFETDLYSKKLEEIEISEIVAARQVLGREALLLTTSDQKCYLVASAGIDCAIPRRKATLKRLRKADVVIEYAFSGEQVSGGDPLPLEDVNRTDELQTFGSLNVNLQTQPPAPPARV